MRRMEPFLEKENENSRPLIDKLLDSSGDFNLKKLEMERPLSVEFRIKYSWTSPKLLGMNGRNEEIWPFVCITFSNGSKYRTAKNSGISGAIPMSLAKSEISFIGI